MIQESSKNIKGRGYGSLRRNEKLKRLIDTQSDDLSYSVIYPEIITPLKPKMLLGLPSKIKASLILSVIGSMSNREIGAAMGCAESSVRGFLKTGYKKLRKRFAIDTANSS